jgi:acyl-CoA synthetase (AMP-forming)/AMP-acid ligase II
VDVIRTASGPAYSLLMEEILLGELSQLTDCSVIAAPAPEGSPLPVALLWPRDPEADPVELLSAVNQALRTAGQHEVAMVHVVRAATEVPLGPSGKVLKRRLRELFLGALTNRRTDPQRAYIDTL